MKRNPETLALAMDYAAVMEACGAYIAVTSPAIREPDAVYRLVRPFITAATGGDKQEAFVTLLLDTKNKLIGMPRIATLGLLNSSMVHPRETFREAVRDGAASVVLCHNHPSGDPTPSKEDADITKRLVEAGRILGIPVVDHMVLGQPTPGSKGYYSMRESNLVAFE